MVAYVELKSEDGVGASCWTQKKKLEVGMIGVSDAWPCLEPQGFWGEVSFFCATASDTARRNSTGCIRWAASDCFTSNTDF